MMVLNIRDAQEKYSEYLTAIKKTRERLEKEGMDIVASDEFELGANWAVAYSGKTVADIEWNVPYMLSFKPKVDQQEKEFSIDNVKNLDDWQSFLSDIATSIINAAEKM